jgi:methionine-rich copper-binding protein CopC
MRLPLIAIAGLSVVGATPASTLAHARLLRADPPVNGVVRGSPKLLRIIFSEPLVVGFSKIQLMNAASHAVPSGQAVLDPRDKRVLVYPLKSSLGPGRYTVRWRAVSADTHRTEGTYAFRILP